MTGGLGTYSLEVPVGNSVTLTIDDFIPGFGYADPRSATFYSLAANAIVIQDFNFHQMGTITGHVLNQDGTATEEPVHLHVAVSGIGGSSYNACTTYDWPYDFSYCYTDPTTGAYSIDVMSGTATVSIDTVLSEGRQAGPAGTTSGSATLTFTVVSAETISDADFYYPAAVHVHRQRGPGTTGGCLWRPTSTTTAPDSRALL